MLNELGFAPPQYVEGRATIADLFKPNERCGIYILHFLNGEFYVGQATDVSRRYIQHCNIHKDIQRISFKPTDQDCLDEEERAIIWQLEQNGWPLRNVVFTSVPKGESDFDFIMPIEEQTRWLNDLTFVDNEGERLVDPVLRRKFRVRYEKFTKKPYATDVLDILQEYIKIGIPAIRRGEVSFWCLSCVLSQAEVYTRVNTGQADSHSGFQNREVCLRINVNWQEVFTAFLYEKKLWFSLHMARSPLEKTFGVNLSRLSEKHQMADNTGHQYMPGGQDQTSFDIPVATAKAFITDPSISSAIRLLNLRLMKKGPCAYGRFHCMDLADEVLEAQ